MDKLTTTLLLANAFSAIFMTGLIWTIQVVHYPLFGSVGAPQFDAYHAQHSMRITWIVMPVMLVELASSIWLATAYRNAFPTHLPLAGAVLVIGVWLSTFALQVPLHAKLSGGFNPTAHRRLVQTNWLRTILWTAHSGVVVAMIASRMD